MFNYPIHWIWMGKKACKTLSVYSIGESKSYLFKMSNWWWNFFVNFPFKTLFQTSAGFEVCVSKCISPTNTISHLQISLGELWLNFVSISDLFSSTHLSFEPRFSTIPNNWVKFTEQIFLNTYRLFVHFKGPRLSSQMDGYIYIQCNFVLYVQKSKNVYINPVLWKIRGQLVGC